MLIAWALAAGGVARPRLEVRRLLTQVERLRDQPGWTGYHEAARVLLSALYADDDVGLKLEHATRAVELARAEAGTLLAPAMATLAFTQLLAGHPDEALSLAREILVEPHADERPFGTVGALAVESIVAAERGNAVVAERAATRALDEATRNGVDDSAAAGIAHFGEALGALVAGRPADALHALARMRPIESAIDGGALHVWVLATAARALAARGRLREAERALTEARGLLDACADGGTVGERVELAAREVDSVRAAATAPVESLSPAELTVLRAFGDDRSARDIGDVLYLSINTVKTHIRAIYRKLGVSTREDAIARASALGLLEDG